MRRILRALAPVVLAAACAALTVSEAQAQGVVTGRVTDTQSGNPIAQARVTVVGTNHSATTGNDGSYTLRNVAAGPVTLRVLRVGYTEVRSQVTVSASGTTADIRMTAVPVAMAAIVTTATGQQRPVEVGNSIAQLDASKLVQTRAVSQVTDLMNSKMAGVQILPGTQTGNGSRVRIRGTSSLSLTNNPIYVIDGVRVESSTGSSSLSVGGSTIARTIDLNPEEIETIEVVRGPSASTLYGTDAANGVIVITTKKGIAGRPEWTYYTEQTGIRDLNEYPDAYRAWRTGATAATNSTASNAVQCFLSSTPANAPAASRCTQDSVTTFNLFKDPETTPYGLGWRQQHGVQVRGGTDNIRYFLSGEFEDEDGVTKVPDFDKRFMARTARTLSDIQQSPNRLTRGTGRMNLNVNLPRNADIGLSIGYNSQDIRLPMSDDSGVSGIGANVFGGPGFKYNLTTTGDTLFGYRQFTPRDIYQQTTNQAIERFIGSVNPSWRPSEWLNLRGTFGLDYAARYETQLCRFANCPDVGTDRQGFKRDNRSNFGTYTVDLAGSANKAINSDWGTTTTVGLQFYRNVFNRNGAEGTNLSPGATTVTAGATKQADETNSESRTLGSFIEENVAFRERLFLTGALRADRNSAFGQNFGSVVYPKAAVSWVVSDESFFPAADFVNQLRFRAAYGASGVQPGLNDAIPFYIPVTARTESGDAAGSAISTLGNPDLKPEKSTELELGVDATLWSNRLNIELTRYDKHSRDALVSRVLPPSIGTGATTRLENIGEVRNWGYELTTNARLLDRESFSWMVTLTGSHNSNKLLELGDTPVIVTSSTISQVEGSSLNAWWARPYRINDRNDDGILLWNADSSLSEVIVDTGAVFFGHSQPRNEVALTNSLELMKRSLRFDFMIDYKGGHMQYNNTERIRCSARLNCQGIIDPNASLEEQARGIAIREVVVQTRPGVNPGDAPITVTGASTASGFFEHADFIRLREVSLTWFPPARIANKARVRDLSITAAVRNGGILWTRYGGVDPESLFGATGDAGSDFQAAAPPSFFTLRFNLGF
jgi:TonB-linked SusC/RagA family outer membrane protein